MKYAVEARIFNNGRIVSKIRPADDGEMDSNKQTDTCDIWVDVFQTKEEAASFLKGYQRA